MKVAAGEGVGVASTEQFIYQLSGNMRNFVSFPSYLTHQKLTDDHILTE